MPSHFNLVPNNEGVKKLLGDLLKRHSGDSYQALQQIVDFTEETLRVFAQLLPTWDGTFSELVNAALRLQGAPGGDASPFTYQLVSAIRNAAVELLDNTKEDSHD